MELKGGRGMWHVDMHVCTLSPSAVVHFDPGTGSGGSMMRMNVRILACIACALATCCVGVAMAREPSEEDQEPNDAITCKLAGNKDPKLDCWPMCVCQKFAWTLEFQPHLRQEIKTTKICENWVEKEVMKPECMVVCASISHAVYGAQGTDPNVCQHAAHEVEMVAGGKVSSSLRIYIGVQVYQRYRPPHRTLCMDFTARQHTPVKHSTSFRRR